MAVGPAGSRATRDQLVHLSDTVDDIIDALRLQRDTLRQHGMSLPPGTLNGFRDVHRQLLGLAARSVQIQNELTQLRALAETTTLVNSLLDVDDVLNEVIDTVIALTAAERGYIVLRNAETGQMEFRIARNLDRETIDEGSFIVSRTIVDHVAQTGEPVITTDAQLDPNFSNSESVVMHALRSILCVPLIVKDQVTGVVYVDNRIKDAAFGEKHLNVLVDFANQAAIAIDNARLFARVQNALTDIIEMKELMENVFASIASGVITTDEADIVTTYNLAAEHILETPGSAVLGMPLADALPALYPHMRDLIDTVRQHSTQETLEMDTRLPERGNVNLKLKFTPLKNGDQTEGVAIVVDDLTDIKHRDATLNVVRRYLPPVMVDNIQSLDGLGLGGERRDVSTIFVEARPFSSFRPHIRPQELMELLNLYLTTGAEAIHNHTGLIDKFMGNEIMGLFNTQLNPSDNHAWLAVQAALKIADDYIALPERTSDDPTPYYRIGIHTGIATLGNVGSASRREFTAIGHTINLAKRLQENAKAGQIIISEAVYHACRDHLHNPQNAITVVARPSVQVKGVSQATTIYEIWRGTRAS